MDTRDRPPSLSRLRRLARAAQPAVEQAPDNEEQCELCGETIPPEHRHMLDLERQRILCACRACAILFDDRAAGGGHYRLVPDRSRYLEGFDLDDALWGSLRLPVDVAFFFRSTPAKRVVAFYPSPLGPTESLLQLDAWQDLVARNPVLETMEPDTEALLVNRANGARDHFLTPVDRCYALVGLIRTRWKGLAGGKEVWGEIDRFFAELRSRSKVVNSDQEKEATWRDSQPVSPT